MAKIYDKNKKTLKNSNFAIFGLGISGFNSCKKLIKLGYQFYVWTDNIHSNSYVSLIDKKYIKHYRDYDWKNIDYLILSPGVPLYYPKSHEIISYAKKFNVAIVCDIELLYLIEKERNSQNQFIAITGTNGKTTTVTLIDLILNNAKIIHQTAGNIGTSALNIPQIDKGYYVFEISSYQLDLLDKTSFDIACLLNITPDHLDRYKDFNHYIESKQRIFTQNDKTTNLKHQNTNFTPKLYITNYDNKICREIHENLIENATKHIIPLVTSATIYKNNQKLSQFKTKYNNYCIINNQNQIECKIGSKIYHMDYHQAMFSAIRSTVEESNMLYIIAIALFLEVKQSIIIKTLTDFQGVKHRMQYIGKRNNIAFFNDSKATNSDSAINSLVGLNNIYLILGGQMKTNSVIDLKDILTDTNQVKHIFLIGESQNLFAKTLSELNINNYTKSNNLQTAFNNALDKAEKEIANKTEYINILLAPTCASFDQWENFEARGNSFINMSQNYINS